MVRWYAAYHVSPMSGNPAQKAALITNGVNQLGIKNNIPLMRIEPNKKGQYYIFLAVECEGDSEFPVPNSLPQLETLAGLPLPRINIPLADRDSIHAISVTPVDTLEFFDRIPRMAAPPTATFHPMDDFEAADLASPSILDKDQVLAQDRLLAWCSAKGSGSWSQFLDACTALGCAEERQSAKRLQRRLRLLGHIETTSSGGWSATPPALVQAGRSQEPNTFFLCGQRTGQMISEITDPALITHDPQPKGDAPSRISTVSETTLLSVISPPVGPAKRSGNVSALLSDNLKPLKEWEFGLDKFPYVFNDIDYVNGGYTVKKYSLSEFHEGLFKQETGLYELTPRDNAGKAEDNTITGYYNEEQGTWYRGEWYGLRFLSKVRNNELYPYDYDSETGSFSILQEWRWPEVYERALVLSSGYLPILTGRRIIYQQIEDTTLAKLHQILEVAD